MFAIKFKQDLLPHFKSSRYYECLEIEGMDKLLIRPHGQKAWVSFDPKDIPDLCYPQEEITYRAMLGHNRKIEQAELEYYAGIGRRHEEMRKVAEATPEKVPELKAKWAAEQPKARALARMEQPKMTLDEAIKHAVTVSGSTTFEACRLNPAQLAEWLTELQVRRLKDDDIVLVGTQYDPNPGRVIIANAYAGAEDLYHDIPDLRGAIVVLVDHEPHSMSDHGTVLTLRATNGVQHTLIIRRAH